MYVATDTGTMWLGTSSEALLQIKDNIDTNTTYTLVKSGSSIQLKNQSGTVVSTITDSNTTYSAATASAAGLMSAADKARLDGMEDGANKTVVDSSLSSTSTNPVQNNVVNSALAEKASTSHNHDSLYVKKTGGLMTGTLEIDKIAADHPIIARGISGRTPDGKIGELYINYDANAPIYFGTKQYMISADGGVYSGKAAKAGVADSANSVAWTNVNDKPSTYTPSSHTHSAANITSGTLDVARLPDVSSKVTTVDASKLSGTIAAANLPSYVDDVLEYASLSDFPETGESGKIYTAIDTNKIYRWSGSAYVVISDTIALGTTHTTAGYGDESRSAYMHSQKTSGNPHNVTKSDIGLENVENKSSATIRSELTKDDVTAALGYTPPTSSTTYSVMKGATSSAAGTSGLVPAPSKGATEYFLKSTGSWAPIDGITQKLKRSSASTENEWYPLLSGGTVFAPGVTIPTQISSAYTGINFTENISMQPLTGSIAAKKFVGDLTGNADTASSVDWSGVTNKPTAFTPSSHTHTKSQITDFPTSMPASDVSEWAKAASKPSYAWNEITSKPTFATVASTGSYTDLQDKPVIPTIPSSLKNPNALTISLNGTPQGAYDGSEAKSINITAASVGAVSKSVIDEVIAVQTAQPTSSNCKLWIKI